MKKRVSFMGYCKYCKEEITEEDFVMKKGELYHIDCWKLMNNLYDEVNFDE